MFYLDNSYEILNFIGCLNKTKNKSHGVFLFHPQYFNTCLNILSLLLNILQQCSHLYSLGDSPWTFNLWRIKSAFRVKLTSHTSHFTSTPRRWTDRTCLSSIFRNLNGFLHVGAGQYCTLLFWLLWTLFVWRTACPFLLNFLSHWSQG